MQIGVIIPVFNRSTLVLDALNSIVAQTRQPTKVIVIDDGSTDGTVGAVQGWKKRHPNFPCQLLSQPNSGAAKARNVGAALLPSNITHIAFLDSDDIWPKDFIARVVEIFEAKPSSVMAVADRELFHIDKNRIKQGSSLSVETNPIKFMLQHSAGIASCSVVSRTHFEQCNGFSEAHPTGHDVVLFGKLATAGSWAHIAGDPIRFRVGFSKSLPSQEPHLYRRHLNHRMIWAKAYQEAYKNYAKKHRMPPADCILCHKFLLRKYLKVFTHTQPMISFNQAMVCSAISIALAMNLTIHWFALLKSTYIKPQYE